MPITREEALLNTMATGAASGVEPITREEQYLSYIAGESYTKPDSPITRKEVFLDRIPQGGGGGGGVTIRNQNKTITENGTYTADSGYTGLGMVTVDVPTGGGSTDSSKGVYGIGDRMMDTKYHCEYGGHTWCKVSDDVPDLETVYPDNKILALRYLNDPSRYVAVHMYVYWVSGDVGYEIYCEDEGQTVGLICTDDGACLGRGVYLECLGDGYGMGDDHQGLLAIMPLPRGLQ